MSRDQWNMTYWVCWMAACALAWYFSGPVAALIVFFLPAILIGTVMGASAEFGSNWERLLRPRRREEQRDQWPDSH